MAHGSKPSGVLFRSSRAHTRRPRRAGRWRAASRSPNNRRTETLKYSYDGVNVVAEYDESDNLSRRFIHGTQRIDERAVMLSGVGANGVGVDSYYYALQELDTVTGLISRNGTLAEAYTYDAYGKVSTWGYPLCDMNRDGDVDGGDLSEWVAAWPSNPATDPVADFDTDGDIDGVDTNDCLDQGTNDPPVLLASSGIGNPYFFTGRRLHMLEVLHDSPETIQLNRQVQYNWHRHYSPQLGRWLERDPFLYINGANLYQYISGRPYWGIDPYGLSWLDWLQSGLDVAGFLPLVGAVPDVINAGISFARGNTKEGLINLAAAIPGLGDAAKGMKMGAEALGAVAAAVKAADKVRDAAKAADKARDALKAADKARDATKAAGKGPGKNAQHGNRRPQPSKQKQLDELKEKLKNTKSRREKEKIKNKMKRIREALAKDVKGTQHSQTSKKGGACGPKR